MRAGTPGAGGARSGAFPRSFLPPPPTDRSPVCWKLHGRETSCGLEAGPGSEREAERVAAAMQSPLKDSPVRPGFHREEIQKTTWDVPQRYAALQAIGSGAYGTVW